MKSNLKDNLKSYNKNNENLLYIILRFLFERNNIKNIIPKEKMKIFNLLRLDLLEVRYLRSWGV